MRLYDLLPNVPAALAAVEIARVTSDSLDAGPGDLFFALEGQRADGHDFVAAALAGAGPRLPAAAAVVRSGHPRLAAMAADSRLAAKLIVVANPRLALGEAAARLHGDPSGRLLVCGVTGTNGKTTSTYLLEALLAEWGKNPAVIGTVENRYGGHTVASTHTTPDAAALQAMLREFAEKGAASVAMEVSSHALDQLRTAGMRFEAALFTNLTQDHLDYHGTMENYFAAKTRLFTDYPVRVRAIHADDPYGERLAAICRDRGHDVLTFGRHGRDLSYGGLRPTADGIEGELRLPDGRELRIRSPLLGAFNAQNLAGAAAVAVGLEVPLPKIESALARAKQVPGRMERVANSRGLTVVVDYAHTPDALEKALAALRPICRGRLVCVMGCGGDRDPGKRPLMGAAAERLADEVIVTSDNPRTEKPEAILDAILGGMRAPGRALRIADRRAAIARAIASLKKGDIALIAGKGHENYQIVGETKLPFDDRVVALENLADASS